MFSRVDFGFVFKQVLDFFFSFCLVVALLFTGMYFLLFYVTGEIEFTLPPGLAILGLALFVAGLYYSIEWLGGYVYRISE